MRHHLFTLMFVPMISLAAPPKSWPIFRGSPELTGYVDLQLSDTPKRLWTFRTGNAVTSTAVASDATVYSTSTDGHMYAIDLKTGKEVWSYNTKAGIEASPLLVGENLYVGNDDGRFICLSAKDGKPQWMFKTNTKIVGSANTFMLNGNPIVIFGCHNNMLYALDTVTRKLIWTFEADNYINSAPSITGNQLAAFGCCDGNLYLIKQASGKLAGRINTGSYIAGSPAIDGTTAWIGNYGNEFMGLDLSKRAVLWSFGDKENGKPFFSSPAVERDRVVVGGRDGNVYCFLKTTGKRLWAFKTRDEVNSSPLIVGNRVVVGSDDGRLYMLKLINGTKTWAFDIGAGVESSPILVGHTLIIGANDGQIYAFDCK
ncbi:hypothetical protein BVX99_01295 [bacterium F16]|nr:hypothetical protein BVX99_01295 [bacterium F16]